jgi:hypothetical protein
MAGLVAPFLEVANPVTSVTMVAHGRTLAHVRFAPHESPYPLIAMIPQDVTPGHHDRKQPDIMMPRAPEPYLAHELR